MDHKIFGTTETDVNRDLTEYREALKSGKQFKVTYYAKSYRLRYSMLGLKADILVTANPREQINASSLTLCFDITSVGIAKCLGIEGLVVWLGDLSFETLWYHAIYDARERLSRWARLPRAAFRRIGTAQMYRKLLRTEAHVIVSSKSSEELLFKLGIISRYMPYPWPDAAVSIRRDQKESLPTFIFFGNLLALGSKSGFDFLLKRVYPHMIDRWGNRGFQILVAGSREMPRWVRDRLPSFPELQFCGFLENLSETVDRCHAVLAPIEVPVGNRSRIITAMAFGSVIIAHANTALGNPELVSGKNCYLASDGQEFFRAMQGVYEDPHKAHEIGTAARDTFEKVFDAPKAAEQLIQYLVSNF